jgi:hypothetical protein
MANSLEQHNLLDMKFDTDRLRRAQRQVTRAGETTAGRQAKFSRFQNLAAVFTELHQHFGLNY